MEKSPPLIIKTQKEFEEMYKPVYAEGKKKEIIGEGSFGKVFLYKS